MYECVVFEHIGQLFDTRNEVHEAAVQAGQMVGVNFVSPIPNLNINTLKDLVCRELHLPEEYYESLEKMVCLDLRQGPHLEALSHFGTPMYIIGDEVQRDYTHWLLADLPIKGFLSSIQELPHPMSKTIVVRDNPEGVYPCEVGTYDQCNLENLLSLLRSNV